LLPGLLGDCKLGTVLGEVESGPVKLSGELAPGLSGLLGEVESGAVKLSGELVSGVSGLLGEITSGTPVVPSGELVLGLSGLLGVAVSGLSGLLGVAVSGLSGLLGVAVSGLSGLLGEVVLGSVVPSGELVPGASGLSLQRELRGNFWHKLRSSSGESSRCCGELLDWAKATPLVSTRVRAVPMNVRDLSLIRAPQLISAGIPHHNL
jgi:hypothetical protein